MHAAFGAPFWHRVMLAASAFPRPKRLTESTGLFELLQAQGAQARTRGRVTV